MHIKRLLIILLIGIFQVHAKELTKAPVDINEISLEDVQSIVKTSDGFNRLFDNLKQEQFGTLDDFLRAETIGKPGFGRPLLIHHSMGSLPASYSLPRILAFPFGDPRDLAYAFSGNKEAPEAQELEVMDWADSGKDGYHLNFYLVKFQGDKPPLLQVNPPKCFQCHGPSQYPRPIFDPEPAWRGAYLGSVKNGLLKLGEKEFPHYEKLKIKHNQDLAWVMFSVLEELPSSKRKESWEMIASQVSLTGNKELFTIDALKGIQKLFLTHNKQELAKTVDNLLRNTPDQESENFLKYLKEHFVGDYSLMKGLFYDLDWKTIQGPISRLWLMFEDTCFQSVLGVDKSRCVWFAVENQSAINKLLTAPKVSRYNLLVLPKVFQNLYTGEAGVEQSEFPYLDLFTNFVVRINLERIRTMLQQTPAFEQFQHAFVGASGCSQYFGQPGFEKGMGSFLPAELRERMQPSYREVKEHVQCNAENRVHFINSAMRQFNVSTGDSISLKESQQHADLVTNWLYLTNSRPIKRPKHFTHLSPAFESGANVLHVKMPSSRYVLGDHGPYEVIVPPLLRQLLKEEKDPEKSNLIKSGVTVFESFEENIKKEFSHELCVYLRDKSISSLASLSAEAAKLPVSKVEGVSRKITDPLNPFASSCAGRVTVSKDNGKTIYTRLVEGTLCLTGTCVRNQFILKLNEEKELIDLVSLHDSGLKKHVTVKAGDTTKQEVPFTPQDVDNLMKNINLAQQDANNPLRRAVEGSWQAASREKEALERSEKFYELLKKALVGDASLDLTTHATVASLKPHVIDGGAYTSAHAYLMYWDTKEWIEKGAKNNTGGLVE